MRRSSLVLVALVAPLLADAAFARTLQPRIVNGLATAAHPSVGALLVGSSPGSAGLACSGTMIGCATFLTAAHCVCDAAGSECQPGGPRAPLPSRYFVFLQHAGTFAVESIAVHPAYDFPVGDVAVLRLAAPATGIRPSRPNAVARPPAGTRGTVVGFGRQGGGVDDYGLKRAGAVEVSPCTTVPPATSVCWQFRDPLGAPGTDSNSCNGDSGGPLFVDLGGGPVLAGVTSGGTADECLPPDDSYDADVFVYAGWIAARAGADAEATRCGDVAQVGDAGVEVLGFEGALGAGTPAAELTVDVPDGLAELRVALHGDERADFDLYLRHGAPPTTATFDCKADGANQFGACIVSAPAAGPWYVLVQRYAGSGAFQLVASLLPPAEACGDVALGGPCDDDNACTADDTCTAEGCVGVAAPDGTTCDDGDACTRDDACLAGACAGRGAPHGGCIEPRAGGSSSLAMREAVPDTRDALTWKWGHGTATAAELGTPSPGDDYVLCVYEERGGASRLVFAQTVPGVGPWTPNGSGWQYADRAGSAGGVVRVRLRAGDAGDARISVQAKGERLAVPALPFAADAAVTVQLRGPAACFESRYPMARTNDGTRFSARSR